MELGVHLFLGHWVLLSTAATVVGGCSASGHSPQCHHPGVSQTGRYYTRLAR